MRSRQTIAVNSALLAILAAGLAAAQETKKYIPPAPVQPLPFSHKHHLAKSLDCKDCHQPADAADLVSLPVIAKCMACHVSVKKESPAIQKLGEYHKKGEEVPWKRVYRVADFVFFSHKTHVTQGKVSCEACHGPVRDRDAIAKESDLSMGGCTDCHKTAGASTACDVCHEAK